MRLTASGEELFGTRPVDRYLTLPHYITANIGSGNEYFEIGIGGVAVLGSAGQHYMVYPIAGLRFQPTYDSRKIIVRIYGTLKPLGSVPDEVLLFQVGLSLGYSF